MSHTDLSVYSSFFILNGSGKTISTTLKKKSQNCFKKKPKPLVGKKNQSSLIYFILFYFFRKGIFFHITVMFMLTVTHTGRKGGANIHDQISS